MSTVSTPVEPRIQHADRLFEAGEWKQALEAYRMAEYSEGMYKVGGAFESAGKLYTAAETYLMILNLPSPPPQARVAATNAILCLFMQLTPS